MFPDRDYSSAKFQTKLHSEHRMLCHKHFLEGDFVDGSLKKLRRSAVPCDLKQGKSGYFDIEKSIILVEFAGINEKRF